MWQAHPRLWHFLVYWRNLILFALVVWVLAGIALAYLCAHKIVHPPRVLAQRTPAVVGISQWRDVSFKTEDGLTLSGWYVDSKNGAAVILVHGGLDNNREDLLDEAGFLAANGYGVLLFDLRNCGSSEGTKSTLGYLESLDVGGALAFVQSQPGIDAGRLGVLGRSMGGATAILAAARYPQVRAVAAESAYTNLSDNIWQLVKGFTGGLPAFPYPPLVVWFGEREAGLKISQVSPLDAVSTISPRPILLVHGEGDTVVPVENAYRMYAAAGEPKDLYIVPHGGHTGFLQSQPQEYPRRIRAFFDRYLLQ